MDSRTWLGSLAEAKVAAEYAKHHWNVFTQCSGKAPFDVVVFKDNDLRRVQVKGTQYEIRPGKYEVQLRSTRHNTKTTTSKRFDSTSCDELVVYIEPIDKMFFIESSELTRYTATVIIDINDPPYFCSEQPN